MTTATKQTIAMKAMSDVADAEKGIGRTEKVVVT